MSKLKIYLILICSLLGGCQTTAEIEQQKEERWRSFIGKSMAEFINTTGLVPFDFYPVTGGRVFVANGPSRNVAINFGYGSPTVVRDVTCRLQIRTKSLGIEGNADNWIIESINRSGACG